MYLKLAPERFSKGGKTKKEDLKRYIKKAQWGTALSPVMASILTVGASLQQNKQTQQGVTPGATPVNNEQQSAPGQAPANQSATGQNPAGQQKRQTFQRIPTMQSAPLQPKLDAGLLPRQQRYQAPMQYTPVSLDGFDLSRQPWVINSERQRERQERRDVRQDARIAARRERQDQRHQGEPEEKTKMRQTKRDRQDARRGQRRVNRNLPFTRE